jgi:hypothetical protein
LLFSVACVLPTKAAVTFSSSLPADDDVPYFFTEVTPFETSSDASGLHHAIKRTHLVPAERTNLVDKNAMSDRSYTIQDSI